MHPQKGTCLCNQDDFVAQLVEQLTLNQWAEGSSPSEVTKLKTSKLLKVFFQEFFFSINASNQFHRPSLQTSKSPKCSHTVPTTKLIQRNPGQSPTKFLARYVSLAATKTAKGKPNIHTIKQIRLLEALGI